MVYTYKCIYGGNLGGGGAIFSILPLKLRQRVPCSKSLDNGVRYLILLFKTDFVMSGGRSAFRTRTMCRQAKMLKNRVFGDFRHLERIVGGCLIAEPRGGTPNNVL